MSTLTKHVKLPIRGAALAPAAPRSPLPRPTKSRRPLLVTSGTALLEVNTISGAARTLAKGFARPTGVAAEGSTAYVVDQAGRRYSIYAVSLSAPLRRRVVKTGTGRPGQLAVHGTTLAFVDQTTATLKTVDTVSGRTANLASGLGQVGGVAFDASGRIHLVETGSGRWVSIAPGESAVTVEGTGLEQPMQLTPDAAGTGLLVAGRHAVAGVEQGYVARLTPGDPAPTTVAELDAAAQPFAAWEISRDALLTASYGWLHWWDIHVHGGSRPVTLTAANDKPYIGSYQRVAVDLGTTGFAFADLRFTIPDGDAGGSISLSHDDLSSTNEVMLLVGYAPGPHKLVATHTPTATDVAVLDYIVTDEWADANASPAHWTAGPVGTFRTGYTWGGGGSTPQNVDVLPQIGDRQIALLMVDVSDARYPAGGPFTTVRDGWRESLVGTTESARAYYEEVSYGRLHLQLAGGTVPLVSLGGDWASQFSMMVTPWPSNSFAPSNSIAFAQACISNAAAQTGPGGTPLIDFSTVRSVVLVVRSQGPAGTDNFFWPQAWGGNFTIPGGSVNLNVLGMPDDWQETRDTRTRTETLCHEIGHNLGYPDLYTNVASWNYSPDVVSRDVTNLDLMSAEQQLPAMTIAQRMESGWVRPEWVRNFDFSSSTVPLAETVTLSAIENGAPTGTDKAGIEIRIADGWNYYFEYRSTQAGQEADQQLGTDSSTGNGAVVGTDVGSQSFSFPISRPQIIRLRPDVEGENSFFLAGEDYKETDTSSMAVADFKMTVLSANATSARVRIEYGTNGRPDLSIRPWPGGDNWQSPDIEVRNARATADPAHWFNVPWEGHVNTVVAKYRNRGPVTCRNVTVDFFIKDFTVGGAPEVWLGRDTKDVPPDSATPVVEFSTTWQPGNQGHRCIIARTPLFLDTSIVPTLVELSDANNSAQSNYTRYISASASPARRVRSTVALHNPFPVRAQMYVMPQIHGALAEYYRLYLEHQSVMLDPGETRSVGIMVESRLGDPQLADQLKRVEEKLVRVPANISLVGYGIPPEAPSHPVLLGGAQIRVDSAYGTRFEKVEVKPKAVVRGRVVTVAGGQGVPGHVLATFRGPNETEDNTISVPLTSGEFALEVGQYMEKFRAEKLTLHYPGSTPYAACDPERDSYSLV